MLTLKSLPWRNLKGYMGRTAALLLFSALMSAAVFGGTMITGGIRNGLNTVKNRLGADIMVTPESAKKQFDAQTVLLKAEPGYFYMDGSVADDIRSVEGVAQASPQMFLASAKAGCCSARLQMIAFDPETDFTIQPWLEDTKVTDSMGLMDVVIGSNVSWIAAAQENVIRFYDRDCHVIGQFAPTGSTLDSAVYMNFDTCRALIDACREKGMFLYEGVDTGTAISSVMVRVKDGYAPEQVAEAIRAVVPGVSVAAATSMISGIADSLDSTGRTVSVLIIALWVLGMLMTVLVFTLMINERRREFASLRAMGAGRRILSGIVVKEALLVNLLGGAAGIVLTAVILYAFSGLISQSLCTGFVQPPIGQTVLAAAAALAAVLLAAGLAAIVSVRKVNQMDASLILKEGE